MARGPRSEPLCSYCADPAGDTYKVLTIFNATCALHPLWLVPPGHRRGRGKGIPPLQNRSLWLRVSTSAHAVVPPLHPPRRKGLPVALSQQAPAPLPRSPSAVPNSPTTCATPHNPPQVDDRTRDKIFLKVVREALLMQDHRVLVFAINRKTVLKALDRLAEEDISAKAYHSRVKFEVRSELLRQFSIGELRILVCSPLAARGIDFPNVTHVVSYEVWHGRALNWALPHVTLHTTLTTGAIALHPSLPSRWLVPGAWPPLKSEAPTPGPQALLRTPAAQCHASDTMPQGGPWGCTHRDDAGDTPPNVAHRANSCSQSDSNQRNPLPMKTKSPKPTTASTLSNPDGADANQHKKGLHSQVDDGMRY